MPELVQEKNAKRDLRRSLTADEVAALHRLTKAQVREAIERGNADRRAAEAAARSPNVSPKILFR